MTQLYAHNVGDGAIRKRIAIIAVAMFLVIAAAGGSGAVLLRARPDLVAAAVDRLRNIVGPAPVAAVEDTYYRVEDVYNRLSYRVTGKAATWELTTSAGTSSQALEPAQAGVAPGGEGLFPAQSRAVPWRAISSPVLPGPGRANLPAANDSKSGELVDPKTQAAAQLEGLPSLRPIITNPALPGEGVWQPLSTLGQPTDQTPILWQTVFRPDPTRPYARMALVAMDLSRSELHIVVGKKEPVSTLAPRGLRTGVIPADMQAGATLLAAWNGGFRAIHGHYGMMTDGVTWLPPLDGMATVAVDPNGSPRIGAWKRGVDPNGAWVAWRQNNPPLLEDGVINPEVIKTANTIRWGASIDGAVFIWRSGMGLTPGRRWLIYAAGNSLSVETLTRGLEAAGASDAMQLDVNASFERFVTFAYNMAACGANSQRLSPTSSVGDTRKGAISCAGKKVELPVSAVKLIDQMQGGPSQFLVPEDRDFFYLTYRAPLPVAHATG